MKFQGGTNIDIDATASLSFYSYSGGNDGGTTNLYNKDSFTLGYSSRTLAGASCYKTGYRAQKAIGMLLKNCGGLTPPQ